MPHAATDSADTTNTLRRVGIDALVRRLRAHTVAWDVEFQSLQYPSRGVWECHAGRHARGYEKTIAALGTEKEVKAWAREFAKRHGLKKWKLISRIEYNAFHQGRFYLPSIGGSWALIRQPNGGGLSGGPSQGGKTT